MAGNYGFNPMTDPARQQEYMKRLGVPNFWDQLSNAPVMGTPGGKPGARGGVDPSVIQEARMAAARQRMQDQYGQQMMRLQLSDAARRDREASGLEGFRNQRFAGANAGAQTGTVFEPSWAAQDWLGKYLYRNLGLSDPTFNGMDFSKLSANLTGKVPGGRR